MNLELGFGTYGKRDCGPAGPCPQMDLRPVELYPKLIYLWNLVQTEVETSDLGPS
jgi:hypothetical protein